MSASKPVRIEPLQAHHIDGIVEVEKLSHSAPWSERSFKNELTNQQSVFVVGIQDGKVIGYAGLWMVVDEAHIINVAVNPSNRRQGIGKALIIHILERAKDAGMLCATLEARASNEAAISLYESLGFERVAVRRSYYPDNQEDALIMWLYGLQEWNA